MERYLLPLAILILCIITIACIIRESLEKEKLQKVKFILTSIITFITILTIGFYDVLNQNLPKFLTYCYPILIVLIGLIMFNSIYLSIITKKVNDKYFECIEETNYFAYLNKSNKIVDISIHFAEFLNSDPKSLKKSLFTKSLLSRYTNVYINDIDYNEENIEKIFDSISTSNQDLKLEIKCLDTKGNDVMLLLYDRPIYHNNKFIGHVLYGKSSKKEEINSQVEELSKQSEKLEMNKLRFYTLLEKGSDCAYFYNIKNNTIWANDALVKTLGFAGNSISINEFRHLIHPSDLAYIDSVISALSPKNPNYDIKYRFKDKYDYVYIHEVGKKIYGAETEIVAVITKQVQGFDKSGNLLLDSCKTYNDFCSDVKSLNGAPMEFVMINFLNIKDINLTHSRQTGSECMSDYLKEFVKNFIDTSSIYRFDGLVFGFIITDHKKMINLKTCLEQGSLTKASCVYSSVKIIVESAFGITSNKIAKDGSTLYKFAVQSLKEAINSSKRYNYHE